MSSARPCLERNIFGDRIVFRMVRHEDSVELIVERDGAVDAGSVIASSSAVLVAGFALSSLLTPLQVAICLTGSMFANLSPGRRCQAT